MLPDDMEQLVAAHLATMPPAVESKELLALRRAVVHAAVEMDLLITTTNEQGTPTNHRQAFVQGARAAVDSMDICFRRHMNNVNPSQYAHALERSYEHERLRKFEAIQIIHALLKQLRQPTGRDIVGEATEWLKNNSE